jgi:hypothetical protein
MCHFLDQQYVQIVSPYEIVEHSNFQWRRYSFYIFILSPCILETRCYDIRLVHYGRLAYS